jgi:cytochrome c biogenesis protein CcdA
MGQMLRWEAARWAVLCLTSFLSFALAAREWGWVRFRLPERKRQTESFWAHDFGFVAASTMWGVHIGLGFATRVTYGGFWALVAVIMALGEPFYGAMLMVVYWLGRALPVWAAPVLLKSASDLNDLPDTIMNHDLVYQRITGAALFWSAVVTLLLALPPVR